jgi:vesicle-fusing ATPase
LLDESFAGVSIDPVLAKLSYPSIEPGYVDPRHCLVFWGRPTTKVKDLIERVQHELSLVAPSELSVTILYLQQPDIDQISG